MRVDRNKLTLLAESLPDAFSYYQVLYDQAGNPSDCIFLEVNPAFEEITGLARDEVTGRRVSEILPRLIGSPFDWLGTFRKIRTPGQSTRFSKYYQTINRWYDITAFSDKPGYFAVVFRDISDSKRAEEELNQLKAFNESIVQNINEGIIMTDEDGKITFVNPALPAMVGYTASELIGKPWTLLVSHDKRPVVELADDRRKDGQIDRYELALQHKTGSEIPVLISGSPRCNAETGEFIGTLAVITNITDRKRAEESILYVSFHDSLTHLYNRAYLEEVMQRLDTPRQLPASVIIADLNGLKLVNDTFGHDAGDRMLKAAADILRKSCRKEDVIARWGGDEFVIFLPQTSEENTKSICRRIKSSCRKVFIEDVPLSISLGVTVKQNVGVDLAVLFKEAEEDMYKHKLHEGRREKRSLLKALLRTLGNKSFETKAHTQRMQKAAMNLGKAVGLPRSELSRLRLLINLHDIGKITIPEEILNKKGPLTPHEWDVIRKHPETGYRIARASEEFAHVAEDILAHHERWDGSGYPQGLKGEDIPLLARVTAVVDAWDIMSTGSAYKKALPKDAVAAEIRRYAGSQFDPELAEVFLSMMKE